MQGLFDPARHEALTDTPWSEDAARSAITRIAAAAEDEFDVLQGAWRTHPQDDPPLPDAPRWDLYSGAGGVIWALHNLQVQGGISVTGNYARWIDEGPTLQVERLADAPHGTASYFIGASGLLLLQWMATRRADVAEQLFAVVEGNLHNSAREALWGNPGTVLAAIHMAEASGEVRWMFLVQRAVQLLLDEMVIAPESKTWIWQQDLYGHHTHWLGAGHGLAGNVFAALRGANCLDALTTATFEVRALQTLSATALHGQHQGVNLVNWHAMIDAQRIAGRLPPVQDCHGAPGIICRLATVPRSAAWDELLRAAGELTWLAGPLAKGPSLCHGTAGSAMACLKLWRRFADPLWLQRARCLAMHALEQVERARALHGQGRHTLWTGDLGVACVLWNCIRADDRFPTLDHF